MDFEVLYVYLYHAQHVNKIQDDIQDGSQNMKTRNFNQSLHLMRNACKYFYVTQGYRSSRGMSNF